MMFWFSHINPDRPQRKDLTPSRIFLTRETYHHVDHKGSQLQVYLTYLYDPLLTNSEFVISLSI